MSNQSIDDLMMQLMSMGFEFPDCQEAVQTGHMSVETAVEWLLAGKPQTSTPATGGPRLTLNRQQQQPAQSENAEGTSNPFVSPIKLKLDDTNSQTGSHSVASGQRSGQEVTSDSQSEGTVTSRMHMSDEQLKVKQNFEAKQREEARMSAMKEKQRRKRDHERILKEIADDRERKKLTTHTHTVAKETKPEQAETSSGKINQTGSPPEKKHTQETCSIQLRMLDGKVIRKRYLSSSQFKVIMDEVIKYRREITTYSSYILRMLDGKVIRKTYPSSSQFKVIMNEVVKYSKGDNNLQLIQAFPHRMFSNLDLGSTLVDLGLVPSASLMVKKGEAKQAVSANTEFPRSMDEGLPLDEDPPNQIQGEGPGAIAPPLLPIAPPAVPVNQNQPQNWGPGHRMDQQEDGNDDADGPIADEDEEDMAVNYPGAGLGAGFGANMGGAMAIGGHAFPHFHDQDDDMAFGGVGQRLIPEGHPQADGSYKYKPIKQVVAEKARERFSAANQPNSPQPGPSETHHSTLTYNVSTLSQLCMHNVASRLTHYDPHHPLLSLSGVSEDLAQKLLYYLLKEKLLKPKTLNAFIPCCLRKLTLDCYPYTTNELLHATRYHNRLQSLSLRSCSLITDSGIHNLAGLKRLKHINVSGCRQITDKSLSTFTEMPSLTSVNLEDTGVTEPGVIKFVSECARCLQHLNLNRTAVTHNIFKHLKGLPELKSLSLEGTQVCGLSGVEELSSLQSLDVSHTDIVTDSLHCLPSSLTCLSISNTDKVDGDTALSYLKNMKLQALNMPSRHTTTDVGLKYLTEMPLSSLDLTNYINIGNEGMQHIGQIKTLKKLLLSNTKITDEGFLYLEGLRELQVLYVDRTEVSDEGLSIIKEFTGLQELSLSSTLVTDGFLLQRTLDPCFYLSKLNLSRTNVTNKGVSCIKSDTLFLLNLDGTCVTPAIETTLRENCSNLRHVTLVNLRPANEDNN